MKWLGEELATHHGKSAEVCCGYCSDSPNSCIAFNIDPDDETCYLLSSVTGVAESNGWIRGSQTQIMPDPPIITPEPTTPKPSTPEPTTPDPTTSEPVTPEPTTPEPTTPAPTTPFPTSCANVTANSNFRGDYTFAVNVTDAAECCMTCASRRGCQAFGFAAHFCYLTYGKVHRITAYGNVAGLVVEPKPCEMFSPGTKWVGVESSSIDLTAFGTAGICCGF